MADFQADVINKTTSSVNTTDNIKSTVDTPQADNQQIKSPSDSAGCQSSPYLSTGNQGDDVLNAFERHQLALKRFISRYLHSAQDIEDVTQEAFLRAYKAEQTTNVRQPKSFLFRIAKNIAISELRTKSRQTTDYIEDLLSDDVLLGEWSTEDEVMAEQNLGIHCEAVASLPPKCRRVYLMRKVYGMSHKEISERLEIATSTVEKHLLKGVEACDRYIRERNTICESNTMAHDHGSSASSTRSGSDMMKNYGQRCQAHQ